MGFFVEKKIALLFFSSVRLSGSFEVHPKFNLILWIFFFNHTRTSRH